MAFRLFRFFARVFFVGMLTLGLAISILSLRANATDASGDGVDRDGNAVAAEAKATPEQARDKYTTNLTKLAIEGKLDPFIGGEEQVRLVTESILKNGNKAVYVLGDAGTGKSALVEQAAGQLYQLPRPAGVPRYEVYRLDLNALMSGTVYRGQLEERLTSLLEFFKNSKHAILFIDELHILMNDSSLRYIKETLKVLMARGEIMLIGATTTDEYTRHLAEDPAFDSRGNKVTLPKVTEAKIFEVLLSRVDQLEKTHGKEISTDALKMTAKLVVLYYSSEPMLRKALDILDRAIVRETISQRLGSFDSVRLKDRKQVLELHNRGLERDLKRQPENLEIKEAMQQLQDELRVIEEKLQHETLRNDVNRLHAEIQQIEKEAAELERRGQLQEAAILRHQVIPEVRQKIAQAQMVPSSSDVITGKHIAQFVATETGIPASIFGDNDNQRFNRISQEIKQRVIGQDHAVNSIIERLKIRQANVEVVKGPQAVILVDGPTGTGKSELARALAVGLFGDQRKLIQIAMNQMDAHSGSSLFGSAPGLVDSDKGGALEELRRNPYSILGFDEIDKTGTRNLTQLLQLLDEGVTKDARGREIDVRNAVVVLQANFTEKYAVYRNVWTQAQVESYFQMPGGTLNGLTRTEIDEKVVDWQMERQGIPPAFRNRMIKVVFNAITLEQAIVITRAKLADQSAYIYKEHGVKVIFDNKVAPALAKAGFDLENNVRPLERARTEYISGILAELAPQFKRGQTVNVSFETAKDGKGGTLVARVDNNVPVGRKLMFKSILSAEAANAKAVGEAGRVVDPLDPKTMIERSSTKGRR